MALLAAIGGISALVWGVAVARRIHLLTAATLAVVLSYVFQSHFWHASLGPVTLTTDRLAIAGVLALILWHWRCGKLCLRGWQAGDTLVALLLAFLTVRCMLTPSPGVVRSHVGPYWRLVSSFWMPACLYLCMRVSPFSEKNWRRVMILLAALGGYLALTAFAEVKHQWWAVFPRYIADPSLGTHFGRARGPALMSACLGVYLTVCFWAAWMLWHKASQFGRTVIAGLLTAMAAGVYYTYTRSTWLGLAGGLAVVPMLQLPKRWRASLAAAGMCGAVVLLMLFSSQITNLGRKDTDGSAEHSVYQRASFARVSWNMFLDAPVLGHGFGRFYDKKLPYLADRRQQLELESIRHLDHHNTLLSILVETGFVGFTLFLLVLGYWTLSAWRLWRDLAAPMWQRNQGLFALAVIIAYLATALFHDVTLSPPEHWLLFLSSGLTAAVIAERRLMVPVAATRQEKPPIEFTNRLTTPQPVHLDYPRNASDLLNTTAPENSVHDRANPKDVTAPRKVELFGMNVDAIDMKQTVDEVLTWCAQPREQRCRYVVTPNVDHAVMFQENADLRKAYQDASLVLADGAPVVLASRLLLKGVPERVAGSDLAPALFARASQTPVGTAKPQRLLRVFLLGAAPGVGDRAKANIRARWQGVEVVGVYSPPLGFEKDKVENQKILDAVAAVQPDLVLVGLGAPKQELWMQKHASQLHAKAALCIGATIDFLAGEKKRAPVWMQSLGLEWLHRVLSEPKRLAKRYARDGWIFPQLLWHEWRKI